MDCTTMGWIVRKSMYRSAQWKVNRAVVGFVVLE